MWTWLALLNVLCTLLPIVTFTSPSTVFLPAFFPSQFDDASNVNAGAIEMPPLALTTQMLQCFLFGIYAHHFAMWTLFIPNLAGFLLGLVWSTLYPFKVVSDGTLRWQWRIQYSLAMLLMLLGLMTIRGTPYLSSTIAAAVGVLMCTYPLPSMSQAYRERNAELMGSAAMNACMLSTCSAWVIHSSPLVEYDIFVLVSNGAGVTVQGSALILRVLISRKRGVAHRENAELSAVTPLLHASRG